MSLIDNPTTTSTNTNNSTNRVATAHPLITSTSQVSKFSANTSSDESSTSSLHVNLSTDTQLRQNTTPMPPSAPAPSSTSTPTLTSLLAKRRNRVCGGIFRPVTGSKDGMGVGVEYAWPYQPAYSHSHSHSQIGGQTDVFGREAREAREEDREGEHSANEAFFRRGSSRGGGGQGVNASGSGANVLGGKEKFSFERDAQTCDDSGEEEGSVVTNLATRKGSERSLSVYSQISLDKANADDVLDLGYKAGEVKAGWGDERGTCWFDERQRDLEGKRCS